MTLYLESSAVLAFWLRQTRGAQAGSLIDAAETWITSDLTQVETDRAFHRAAALRTVNPTVLDSARRFAAEMWASSYVLGFEPEVIESARQPLPNEPVRSLDALHLAFYEMARRAYPEIAMLSLDQRVRSAVTALGGNVLPA